MGEAPHLRCSDADRDRAAAVLRDGLGDGRIDVTELDERLDRVYRARTYGELDEVMADLPAWAAMHQPTPPPYAGPAWPVMAPAPPLPVRRRRPFFAWLAVVWLLWAVGSASATGAAVLLQIPILLVIIWGFVLLARRGRRGSTSCRRLPPWR